MTKRMGFIEQLERALFGDYTGTPEARRDFARRRLLSMGFRADLVDRTLREEDARLKRTGGSW